MIGFGIKIKELREEKNLSQMELSRLTDISQSAIARYELEKTEPRLSDIRKLCLFFECSANFLLNIEDMDYNN